MDELVVTSNKLANNFAGCFTSRLGPDVAHRPPAVPRCCRLHTGLLLNYTRRRLIEVAVLAIKDCHGKV